MAGAGGRPPSVPAEPEPRTEPERLTSPPQPELGDRDSDVDEPEGGSDELVVEVELEDDEH